MQHTLTQQGLTAHRAGNFPEAERLYRLALQSTPDHAEALHLLGVVFIQTGRFEVAEKHFAAAATRHPARADFALFHGMALLELGQMEPALRSLDAALARKSDYLDAWLMRGDVLGELGRMPEAIASFQRAAALDQGNAVAFYKLGLMQAAAQRNGDALESFSRAIALNNDYFEAFVSRGNLLLAEKRAAEAVHDYDRALALEQGSAGTLYNRGHAHLELKQPEKALADYDRALALEPGFAYLEGARLHVKMQMCDWSGFEADSTRLLSHVEAGRRAAMPFVLLALPSTPAEQKQCAQQYGMGKYPPSPAPLWRGEKYRHEKIRVAYLSGAYLEHPVALSLTGVFSQHDKSRFEIIAVSSAPDDGSKSRRRLASLADRFIDISRTSDAEAAAQLRALEIDILVDLDGYTDGLRTRIAALRVAPVQVSYLGYPSTMGVPYIDYVIGDRITMPEAGEFSERTVCLPDSFFPANLPEELGPPPSRTSCGLPEKGVVFCAFNNNYKITPDIFAVWMRLLAAVNGSVLWLRQGSERVRANLLREAAKHGIGAERLVFAIMVPERRDHLARQQLADIFLDTLYYNAHSTAYEALWCGVPVVTLPGLAFAGRVAASIVMAAGLTECVAQSLAEYERIARELARDAGMLAALKARLADARKNAALFDATRYTRNLEAALEMMHRRQHGGEIPTA